MPPKVLERARRPVAEHDESPPYYLGPGDEMLPVPPPRARGKLWEIKDGTLVSSPHIGQARAYMSDKNTIAIVAGAQSGKALALDTPIYTSVGWLTMGTVDVGDSVLDVDGQWTRITYVSPVYVGHQCYCVFFNNGSHITADAQHLWPISNSLPDLTWPTLATHEIIPQLEVTPDDVWVGQGSRHQARITKIVSTESVPVRCIAVESGSHVYLCGRNYVPTHNTSLGPLLLEREIGLRGPGDYMGVSPTVRLSRMKMVPEFLSLFERGLKLGTWHKGDRFFEFDKKKAAAYYDNPEFLNEDTRVIFGSAVNPESLESATAKGVWLDECVAPETLIDTELGPLRISDIVNRALPIRVWSYDTTRTAWELKPIMRWIRLPQSKPLVSVGDLRITGNHKIWTRERGYVKTEDIVASAGYHGANARTTTSVLRVRTVRCSSDRRSPAEILLQQSFGQGSGSANTTPLLRLRTVRRSSDAPGAEEILLYQPRRKVARGSTVVSGNHARRTKPQLCSASRETHVGLRETETEICGPIRTSMGAEQHACGLSYTRSQRLDLGENSHWTTLDIGGQWAPPQLASGETGESPWLAQRIRGEDRPWLVATCLQDRYRGASYEGGYRSRQPCEQEQAGMVCGEWVDVYPLLQSDGRGVDGGLSSDGCVYNLEVEGNHNYVADGLLVSNCGQKQFRLESWEAIERRCMLHQARKFLTTTPYGSGGWLKVKIYDPWMQAGCNHPDIDVIQFASDANPAFPRDALEKMRAAMPPWRFALFYLGQFMKPDGLIYSSFMDYDRTIGGHLVKPFTIPPEWPRYVGIDFGGANMASVWLAQNPGNGEFYLYHETLDGGLTSKQHADGWLKYAQNQGIQQIRWVGGNAAEEQQRRDFRSVGLPILGPPIIRAPDGRAVLLTNVEVGISRVLSLMISDRLFVFENCKGTRAQFTDYSRVILPDGTPSDEIDEKGRYHYLDATRAICQRIFSMGATDMSDLVVVGSATGWQPII